MSIRANSVEDGKLTAKGKGGTVEISGGTVNAESNSGAGIGGGYGVFSNSGAGSIKITGGSVTYSGVTEPNNMQAQPTDAGSTLVHKTTLTLGDSPIQNMAIS